jgi:CelD/BcsL family acetyltransferase involved in cellulose biosynthesis
MSAGPSLAAPPAAPGPTGLSVQLAPLPALRAEWDWLEPRSRTRNVFTGWTFAEAWWEHFREGADGTTPREGRVFVVRNGAGQPVAIVPLYVDPRPTRVGRARVLRNVGYGDVVNPDFLDALCIPGLEEPVAAALAPHLFRDPGWDFAQFSELAEGGSLSRMAEAWSEARLALVRRETRSPCPYLELPGSFDEFMAARNPHFRQQLRRYRRKIERELGVEWKRVGKDLDVDAGMDLLARLHQARMEATGRGGNFKKDDYQRFHRALAARLAQSGELYFWILTIEGLPGASHYGFLHDGVYYGYQMGFTPQYERWSLGHYMTGVVVEKLIEEERAREMSLLRGRDAWKFRWTDSVRYTEAITMIRPGLRSRWLHFGAVVSQSPPLVLRSLIGRDAFDELRSATERAGRLVTGAAE